MLFMVNVFISEVLAIIGMLMIACKNWGPHIAFLFAYNLALVDKEPVFIELLDNFKLATR